MMRKMVIPGERIAEEGEYEDTDDTDSVESYPDIASIGDIDRTAHGVLTSDSHISSPGILSPGILSSDSGITSPGTPGTPSMQSPVHTRPHGKAKKAKDRGPFYKKGDGVVYLPGDINGLAKKLQLLAAEFFAGNTTVNNELGHVLHALLRLKQCIHKEYADITARLAASL